MTEPSHGLETIADRHGVSLDAVRHLVRALEAGQGRMAQFNHPDLGGFGQWSGPGMTMIGDMFNTSLKARVDALCTALADALPPSGFSSGSAGADAFWPAEWGVPSTSGSQNGQRYAYFPGPRRLAIETGGRVALYDTGAHAISGVAQQQGGNADLRFSGPGGPVDLAALRRLDEAAPSLPPRRRARSSLRRSELRPSSPPRRPPPRRRDRPATC